MTNRARIARTVCAALVAAPLLVVGVRGELAPSFAQAPASSASASTSSAVAAASSSGTATKLPRLADDLPPPEKSEVPKAADWKTATPLRFDRSTGDPRGCAASRLREWVRITCEGAGSMASVIAGSGDGWSASIPIPPPNQSLEKGSHWMQFPVRRGERRLMEIRSLVPGNYGEGLYVGPGIIVSVDWLDGEPPTLRSF